MTDAELVTTERRIRPWIAALLTFAGWGVGLYYARKTRAAIWWAIASAFFGVAMVFGVLVYSISTRSTPVALLQTGEWSLIDFVQLASAAALAVWVWIATAKTRTVPKGTSKRLWGYLGIWLLPIVASLLLALPIRFGLFQPFRTPAGSMQPTLMVGDYFAATKWSYGYNRFSFAPLDGLFPEGRLFPRTPARGDIVVFRSILQGRDLVKRIVGMPGDRIQVSQGILWINGAEVKRNSIGARDYINSIGEHESIPTYRETLPNGISYLTLDRDQDSRLDNTDVFLVPPEAVFVLGDDRDNSADSRTPEVSYVAFDTLIGRVDYILPANAPR